MLSTHKLHTGEGAGQTSAGHRAPNADVRADSQAEDRMRPDDVDDPGGRVKGPIRGEQKSGRIPGSLRESFTHSRYKWVKTANTVGARERGALRPMWPRPQTEPGEHHR